MYTAEQLATAAKALAEDPQLRFRLEEDVRRLAAVCRDWRTWAEIDSELAALIGNQSRGPEQVLRLMDAKERFEQRAADKRSADDRASIVARANANESVEALKRQGSGQNALWVQRAGRGTANVLNVLSDRVAVLHRHLSAAHCESDIRAVLVDLADSLQSTMASISLEQRESIEREDASNAVRAA